MKHSILAADRGSVLSVLLVTTGVLCLAGTEAFRYLRPATDVIDGIPELDSFSEPAIAVAVLQKHADELIWQYAASRHFDRPTENQSGPSDPPSAVNRDGEIEPQRLLVSEGPLAATLPKTTSEWIERLHQEIRQFKEAPSTADLEIELLLIYKENHLWNEFLDCYLGILGGSPGSQVAISWAPCALEYSKYCQRTEEVRDALQHQARFHRNPKVAYRIQVVLDQWSEANGRIPADSKL